MGAACRAPGANHVGTRGQGLASTGARIMNPPPEQQHLVSNLPHARMPRMLMEARTAGPEADGYEVELRAWFNVLADSRWLIAGVALCMSVLALAYALLAMPVYQANMTIQVEEERPTASSNIVSETSSLFETKRAPVAEIELLRSRMLIAEAVDQLRLTIDVRPNYFPVIGAWIAAHAGNRLSRPGLFGLGGYVWGAEKASVAQFEVPAAWEHRLFVMTAQGAGRYRLADAAGLLAIEGEVGTPLAVETDAGRLALRVDSLAARPGAQFLLRKTSRLDAIETVQRSMAVTEQGKQSGILEATLQGPSAQWVSSVLAEVGREYIRQNQQRKALDAQKSLRVLNGRLDELKQQLEQSETEFKQFRERHGTVQPEEEAKISLGQAAAANTLRIELVQKKRDLLTRFGNNHPQVAAIDEQLSAVEGEIRMAARRIKKLPTVEQDEVRLARDIKVNTDIYAVLSNAAQQLRIIAVGKASSVRLIDMPLPPEKPIKPNRPLIVALGAATGLFLGMVLAFFRKSVYGGNGIENPETIEKLLGPRVLYATIPHSDTQEKFDKRRRREAQQAPLLAAVAGQDGAIESLRAFRAALQFSLKQSKNNIIMLTGPTAGIGKSFVSANFAALMAAGEKKVLLLDADFRHGCLHRYFGVGRGNGLYEYIAGQARADKIIQRSVMSNLDFIPAGDVPMETGEFLHRLDLAALLESLHARYDFVVVDLPSLLEVADVLTIGGQADAMFLIARARVTTEAEIGEALKRLYLGGIAPQGILFNDVKARVTGGVRPPRHNDAAGRAPF
jgi:tyrosine-protein kinase Etk/Wzc